MGAGASSVVKVDEAIYSKARKEVLVPVSDLTNHIKVYQHNSSGELLIMVDQTLESFLGESARDWDVMPISKKQSEYFNEIKISLTAKTAGRVSREHSFRTEPTHVDEYTNADETSKLSSDTAVRDKKESSREVSGRRVVKNVLRTVEDVSSSEFNDSGGVSKMDYKADEKPSSRLQLNKADNSTSAMNAAQSKATYTPVPRKFTPKPYPPPSLRHNDMTKDMRIQSTKQQGVGGGGAKCTDDDDPRVGANSNKNNVRSQRVVPTKCSICHDTFKSTNIDVIEEHEASCAVTLELRHCLEEVNRKLRPALQEVMKTNHNNQQQQQHQQRQHEVESDNHSSAAALESLNISAAELDRIEDMKSKSLNYCVETLVHRVLDVSHTYTCDGRAVDMLQHDIDYQIAAVLQLISGSNSNNGNNDTDSNTSDLFSHDGPSKASNNSNNSNNNSSNGVGGESIDDLHVFFTVLEEAGCQLREKVSVLARFNRTQLSVRDFKFLRCIGKGGFGRVYLAQRMDNKKLCAVKVMSKTAVRSSKYELQILRERKAMSLAGSQYPDLFVRLQCSFHRNDNLFLVMEYLPGGDVMTLLHAHRVLSEPVVQHIMAQVCLAVKHLHAHGVVHRDIKPDNVMITNRGHVKLGDFGLVAPFVRECVFTETGELVSASVYASSNTQNVSAAQAKDGNSNNNSMSLSGALHGHQSPPNASSRLISVPAVANFKRSRSSSTNGSHSTPSSTATEQWLEDDSDIVASPSQMASSAWSTGSDSSIVFQKPNEHLKITAAVGNYNYACPEFVIRTGYDHTVDWWAVGVMTFHLLAGQTPFESASKDETLANIVTHNVNWDLLSDLVISDDCKEFIAGIITKDTEHREQRLGYVTSEQIIRHAFFADVDWRTLYSDYGPYFPQVEGANGKEFHIFATLNREDACDVPDFMDNSGEHDGHNHNHGHGHNYHHNVINVGKDDGTPAEGNKSHATAAGSETDDEFVNFSYFG